jgi:uncharacterized membrane protein
VSEDESRKQPIAADQRVWITAERAKAFIDAVVAIAMTLLILPLMDSISEATSAREDAAGWFENHESQLISFVLSFVIIAMFWVNHHEFFSRVKLVSNRLVWINMAWLLTIVWLPVATAMIGQMKNTDAVAKAVYIGTMILTCLLTLALRLYLRAHPMAHDITDNELRQGMGVDIAMAVLFAVALVIAVAVPVVGAFSLFLMFLTGPVSTLFARMLGGRRSPAAPPKAR